MSTARPPTLRVYWYSQTGQLKEAADAFVAPLAEAGWDIQWRAVTPRPDFPFPWSIRRFVGIVPQAVHPHSIVDIVVDTDADAEPADLVLFAFQVWYLAPSIPMRSVVAGHPELFAGRAVVGLTACRNMWYSAAMAVRRQLTESGAHYLGTVAAIDDAPPAATFVTTMRWMLTGRREAFWAFPRAGVGAGQLARLRSVGEKLASSVPGRATNIGDRVTEVLGATDAAPVEPAIAAADLLAGRVFRMWSAAARAVPPGIGRNLVLGAFACWLSVAVAIGLPVVVLIRALARRQFDGVVRRALRPAVVRP